MGDIYTVKALRDGKFEVVPRATDRRSIYENSADAAKRANFLNWELEQRQFDADERAAVRAEMAFGA